MSRGIWKIFAVSIVAIVAAVSLFLVYEPRPKAAEIDAATVLNDGINAFSVLSVTGSQRVTIFRDGKPALGKVIQTPVEPFQPQPADHPDERAKAKLWAYNRLLETAGNFRFNDDFFDSHAAKVLGAEKIAGRWAWEVEIRPDMPEAGYLRVLFDKDTGYPLKRVKYDRCGKKESSVEYVKIKGISYKDKGFRRHMHNPPDIPRRERSFPRHPIGEGPTPGRPHTAKPPPGTGLPPKSPPTHNGFPKQGPVPKHEIFFPPEVFIKDFVAKSLVLFPAYIPEGYRFVGAVKLPMMFDDKLGKVHMIFTDRVNNISIFQIHLPHENIRDGDFKDFLRAKAKEFLNTFPEGCALRKVEDGLIVGMGDIDPAIIEKMLDSMVLFKGNQPVQFDKKNLNPEGLF